MLSVHPSVTWVYQSKTVEVRIMQLSLHSSPVTVVSSCLTSPRNSKGNIERHPTEAPGAELEEWDKYAFFSRISETVQDRTKVTIND